VSFTPGTVAVPVNLASSQGYTVTITTGILNNTGESMAADYSWSFTTAADLVPEISVFSSVSEIFSGDNYDFGSVDNSIWNNGSGNLNIASISSNNTEFVVFVNPSPVMLIPGANTSFTLNFTPSTAGDKTAQVAIGSDDSDENPFVINLQGVSLSSSAPEIQFTNAGEILQSTVSTVDFGTLIPGATGTLTLVLRNIGSANLTVTGVTPGGTNPGLFSTDFVTPATVTPGSTLSFNVSFSSPDKINARATISFQNNDSDENPFTIKLKGRVK